MKIVLEISGKREAVYNAKVRIFTDEKEAIDYCQEVTDPDLDEKYWNYAKIIEENKEYVIGRYSISPKKESASYDYLGYTNF